MAIRLQAMAHPNYVNGFIPTMHPGILSLPLSWKKPQMVFVNSMSDLFHESVTDEFISQVFVTMNAAHWHNFQVLTKRSERLCSLAPKLKWGNNIWMGVTVESSNYIPRIYNLHRTDAHVKFISFEPLLGPIQDIDLSNIDWVIVGGESGPGARLMQVSWVTELCSQCKNAGVPFFFKQWGGFNKKKNGRELNGRIWAEMPLQFITR
jgi:protein gp37